MKGIWIVLAGLLLAPGTITYRAGSEVYLQAGSRQGLSVGQVFWVVSPEGDTAGRIEVLSVSETRALARIVEESILIQPGFRVLLPRRGEETSPAVPSPARSSVETGTMVPVSRWRGSFSIGGDVQNLTRRSWRWFSRAWAAFRRGPWEGAGLVRVERIARDSLAGLPGQEWRPALYRVWLGALRGPVRFRVGRFLAHTLPVRVDGGEVRWTFRGGSLALFGGLEARPDSFSTGESAGGLAFAWTLPGGRGEIQGGYARLGTGDNQRERLLSSFLYHHAPIQVRGVFQINLYRLSSLPSWALTLGILQGGIRWRSFRLGVYARQNRVEWTRSLLQVGNVLDQPRREVGVEVGWTGSRAWVSLHGGYVWMPLGNDLWRLDLLGQVRGAWGTGYFRLEGLHHTVFDGYTLDTGWGRSSSWGMVRLGGHVEGWIGDGAEHEPSAYLDLWATLPSGSFLRVRGEQWFGAFRKGTVMLLELGRRW